MVQLVRDPKKETLTPDPNGVTQVFQTPAPYKDDTVSVWLNGLRLIQNWDDGFDELGGSDIRMKEIPLTGDILQAMYEAL